MYTKDKDKKKGKIAMEKQGKKIKSAGILSIIQSCMILALMIVLYVLIFTHNYKIGNNSYWLTFLFVGWFVYGIASLVAGISVVIHLCFGIAFLKWCKYPIEQLQTKKKAMATGVILNYMLMIFSMIALIFGVLIQDWYLLGVFGLAIVVGIGIVICLHQALHIIKHMQYEKIEQPTIDQNSIDQ